METAKKEFEVEQNGQDAVVDLSYIDSKDGISFYRLSWNSPTEIIPQKTVVKWSVPKKDIAFRWYSQKKFNRNLLPDWNSSCAQSRSASGTPIISLINKNDKNSYTIALSDCKTPITLRAGVREKDSRIVCKIELFTQLVSPLKEYETIVRIDERKIPLEKVLSDVRKWWTECGYTIASLPRAAKLPMYSTWYSMHQDVTDEKILEQCRIAKKLGMESVIIDDGWQTDDNGGNYMYCGDWQVCEKKIPNFKKLVEEIHEIGMKVIVWFSVPFVGIKSDAYKRFQGKLLYSEEWTKAYVLDPRFKDVRKYLVNTYVSFMRLNGIDGFKLDFIDSIELHEYSPKNFQDMDYISMEDAVERLLAEISIELRKIDSEVMIEFRQRYIGAVMQQYGNMFRVYDCPGDEVSNKVGTVDLRLMTNGIAVHSDPIMWHYDEDAETAAYQLNHTLFAVPQISLDLSKLPEQHIKMLKHYLQYQTENREILLFGEISPRGIAYNYLSVTARGDKKDIIALYGESIADIGIHDCDVINATGNEAVYLALNRQLTADLTVTDCMGNIVRHDRNFLLKEGLNKIYVPVSGFLLCKIV